MAALAPALVAIVGPTASGKSALALRLARERGGEIVSCDSLQVYRGLDIGSAKATPEERAAVAHHLLDVVAPEEAFSAADYARLARAAIAEIRARGRLPIVAGGTGLYLRALLHGPLRRPLTRRRALRQRLERPAERFSGSGACTACWRGSTWRPRHGRIPRDRVRIVRALEVYWLTGRPITAHQESRKRGRSRASARLVLGLAPDRARCGRRSWRRTRQMLERGLLAEVEALLGRERRSEPRPLGAIGYRQAVQVVRGELGLDEAERSIVTGDDALREAADDLVPAPGRTSRGSRRRTRPTRPRSRGSTSAPAARAGCLDGTGKIGRHL